MLVMLTLSMWINYGFSQRIIKQTKKDKNDSC